MPKKRPQEQKKKNLESAIVENLIQLQRVHTSLAEKFDKLADQIATLLGLFEATAKEVAKQPFAVTEKDQAFLEKIDKLLEQNKVIAKGLTLMEERIREKAQAPQRAMMEDYQSSMPPEKRPLPRF